MSIEFSKDIADPPQFLNVEFFQEVAEKALRLPDVKVHSVKISMGSSTGENYCSIIYRADIEYTLKKSNEVQHLWVICKTIIATQATDFLEDLAVYQKEEIFYYQVLPRLEILLPEGEFLGCRLLHSQKKPAQVLVFEDLKMRNFIMAHRESGLDQAHAILVMKRLAQFHAASLILAQKDPKILEAFSSGMMSKDLIEKENSFLLKFLQSNTNMLIERVSEWPGYKEIAIKLKKFALNLAEKAWRSQTPLPGEFRVLNHGDLWVNNMLFKYDKFQQRPEEVLFIDLQLSVWCSPGIDLNYFFYTSLSLDLLKHGRETLLKIYYRHLCSNLKHLKYADIPSYQQIFNEVQRRQLFGFIVNYAIFPIITMPKELSHDSCIENLVNDEFANNKIKAMYSSKRVIENLQYTLKQFDEMGILD